MNKDVIANTAPMAIKKVADKLNLDTQVVDSVVKSFIDEIKKAMIHEIPFAIQGFGKFYHAYINRKNSGPKNNDWYDKNPDFFKDKVVKEVKFEVAAVMKNKVNGWVHDLGMKNNIGKGEVGRMVIKPEEIMKIRRVKLLEEQRRIGFRPELLFDDPNLLEGERQILDELEKAPSVDEIVQELGIKLDGRGDLSAQKAASIRHGDKKDQQ